MLDTMLKPHEIYQRREEFGLRNSKIMLDNIMETYKGIQNRKEAIKYLSLISIDSPLLKKECFESLENVLISDDSIGIKCEAAKALGKIKYKESLKPLKWILEQETIDNNVKLSVLKAIKKIRFEEPEIKLFINELNNQNDSIQKFVKGQLFNSNPEKLINLSLDSLKNKELSSQHKAELIKLIGNKLYSLNISFEEIREKYPEILSNLIQNKNILLKDITLILKEDSELMNSSITILKVLGHEIEKEIIKLLLVDDFIVKKNAVKLSGKLKLVDAVDFLINNIDNIYNEVSIASIKALGEIGDVSAVPELLDVLDIEDISFEYTDLDMKFYILDAIKIIYQNNKNSNYDYLYSYLRKDNNTIKESIAFILGEIDKEDFVDPLIDLLKVRNLDVKKNAIIALGKIGNVRSLDHLIKILEDEKSYWLIKKIAVDAIYQIFQRNWFRVKNNEKEVGRLLNKVVVILIDHLSMKENENFKVKLSLIKFLETYGGQQALSALIKRINDFHRIVIIHASNAIKKIEERLEMENSS